MEKISNLAKAIGEAAHVIGQFPLWFKVICLFSAVYILVFGGMFIFQYAKHSVLLKTSAAATALEKKALSGDSAAMIELSLSGSPRAFDVLSSLLHTSPDDHVRQSAVVALAN